MNVSYDLVSSLLIAIVQGFTEWFPVSSDGHLVVVGRLLGYSSNIVKDVFSWKWESESGRLGLMIIVGTIPVVIFGFLLKDVVESSFSSLIITSLGFGVTAMILFIASVYGPKEKKFLGSLGYRDALLIGCVQVSALLPGISRSAMTLSVAILLGYTIRDAAKYSFLLSIPAVFGANVLVVGNNVLPQNLIWATLLAFVVGLLAIFLLFRYAFNDTKNLRWFAAYALLMSRLIEWRASNAVTRVEKPLRLDRARALGYKAKVGFVIVRVRLKRGGRTRSRAHAKGRKSTRQTIRKTLKMNYQWVAEIRAEKKYKNLNVLNSYPIGKDGKYFFFEVILVDSTRPEIKNDRVFAWLVDPANAHRAQRGLTSAAKKSRGLRSKSHMLKVRPSLRAWNRRGK
jgi:large subunit ribosomal protein L15e